MGKRLHFRTGLIAPLQVEPGSEVGLSRDHDPGYTGGVARPQAAAPLADGVVVRVHEELLAAERGCPPSRATGIWARRYREINDSEHCLAGNGIRVVKVLLISPSVMKSLARWACRVSAISG
jgi:hypothetical protein